MRYTLGGSFTGSAFLDFLIAGVLIGMAAQSAASVLSGKIPGPGLIFAGIGGGVVATIVFVFKSGMNY
ncbi:MAG: hypothetical protein AAGH68_04235 [Pseudomonadota bacterium]